MYIYEFNDEKVIFEKIDCLISYEDKEMFGSVLVTDKNILIFTNVANPILRAREIHELPQYELQLKVDLESLNYEVDEENTIIHIGEKELMLYNFDLKKVKNQ